MSIGQIGIISGPTKVEIVNHFFSESFSPQRQPIIFRTRIGIFTGHLNSLSREGDSGNGFFFEGYFNCKKMSGYYRTDVYGGYMRYA